jgi:hypothetical protein
MHSGRNTVRFALSFMAELKSSDLLRDELRAASICWSFLASAQG